jgi:hypothetical protein
MRLHSPFLLPVVLMLLWGCQSQVQLLVLPATAVSPPTPSHTTAPSTDQTGPSQGCYYVWATRDLPELSSQLQAQMAAAGSPLGVSAYAFGEECRAESGEVAFLAMETDFRVRVPVDSLGDEEALGTSILIAMTIIEALPAQQLAGDQPGRVDFEFAAGDSQSLRLNIDIARFRHEAAGLRGAELYQYFEVKP